jgi:hypothetical protein
METTFRKISITSGPSIRPQESKMKLLKVKIEMTYQEADGTQTTATVFESIGDVTVKSQEFTSDMRREGLGLMCVGKSISLTVQDNHSPLLIGETWRAPQP